MTSKTDINSSNPKIETSKSEQEIFIYDDHEKCDLCPVVDDLGHLWRYVDIYKMFKYWDTITKKYTQKEIMSHPINEKHRSIYGYMARKWEYSHDFIGNQRFRLEKAIKYNKMKLYSATILAIYQPFSAISFLL